MIVSRRWFQLFALFFAGCVEKRPDDPAALVAQLRGETCRFLYDSSSARCELTRQWTSWVTRNFEYRCIADAARCLGRSKDPGALPALTEFLENGMNDVDTGDGILSVRGAAAEAVAELGDPRALPALERALQRFDPAVRSATGGFPAGYVFKSGTSHPAIRRAIEKLREAKPPTSRP